MRFLALCSIRPIDNSQSILWFFKSKPTLYFACFQQANFCSCIQLKYILFRVEMGRRTVKEEKAKRKWDRGKAYEMRERERERGKNTVGLKVRHVSYKDSINESAVTQSSFSFDVTSLSLAIQTTRNLHTKWNERTKEDREMSKGESEKFQILHCKDIVP